MAVDSATQRGLAQARAVAHRAGGHLQQRLNHFAHAGREGLNVAAQKFAIEAHHHAAAGQLQARLAANLERMRLGVEQPLHLVRGEVRQFLVVVETLPARVVAAVPIVEAGRDDRAFVERFGQVHQRFDLDPNLAAHSIARRAHARHVIE